MLSNTLRLNFCYLTIMHILHLLYHPKIVAHILKNKQKNKCVYFHKIIRLIIMKMEMNMENRSHRYGINRPSSRHGHKYSKYKSISKTMLICIKQHLSNIEAQSMKILSNTETELKRSVAYKNKRVFHTFKEKHVINKCLANR